jgi:hypothetical protein
MHPGEIIGLCAKDNDIIIVIVDATHPEEGGLKCQHVCTDGYDIL